MSSQGSDLLYPWICSLSLWISPLPMGLTPPCGSNPSPTGSQPQALRRLAAGPTPCEGDIQVFHAGQWWDLCDSGAAQRGKRGQQICRELGCGNLTSSTEIREPPSMGVTCGFEPLHLCQPKLGNIRSCSQTRVVCKPRDPCGAGSWNSHTCGTGRDGGTKSTWDLRSWRGSGYSHLGTKLQLGTSGDIHALPRPGLKAASHWNFCWNHCEHLPGPAAFPHPFPDLWPSRLSEADEEK